MKKYFVTLRLVVKMTRRFLVCIFLLVSTTAFSKSYIKLYLHDCAKCSLVFQEVNDSRYLDSVFVVMPEQFEKEEEAFVKNLGLGGYKKFHYVYSDSLYEYLGQVGSVGSSEFNIIRDSNIVYNSSLEPGRIDNILYQIYLDNNNSFCPLPEVQNSQMQFKHFGRFIVSLDNYSNVYVFDIKSNTYKVIDMGQPDNLNFIYNNYYQSDFEKKYPPMKKFILEHPKFKPESYQSYVMINENKLLIHYKLWDFEVNTKNDTSVSMRNIIATYNVTLNKFENAYTAKLDNKNTSLNLQNIFLSEGQLVGFFSRPKDKFNKTEIYPLLFDKKKGEFSVSEKPLNRTYPANYYKRLDDAWTLSVEFSNHTILHYMADSIYSTYHKKMIRIPYPNINSDISSIRNGYNGYSVSHKCFYLTYTLNDNHNILYYLSFDENGNRKSFKAKKNTKEGPAQFLNPFEEIQFVNSDRCFRIKKI